MDPSAVERLRQEIDQEFFQDLQRIRSMEIGRAEMEAFQGALLIKYLLQLATTHRRVTDFNESALFRKYGNAEENRRLAAGFRGELGAATVALEMGAAVFLPSAEMDVRYGIDLIFDVSEMGNERFAIEGTYDQNTRDSEYYYLAISVKTSVQVPRIDGFSLVYPCRSSEEVSAKLQSQQASFYDYYRNFGEPSGKIDYRWGALHETILKATESLNGFDRNGHRKSEPICNQYDNVEPCVILMPSINDPFARHYDDGLPNNALEQRLLESLME
jgi:hypothetical protein